MKAGFPRKTFSSTFASIAVFGAVLAFLLLAGTLFPRDAKSPPEHLTNVRPAQTYLDADGFHIFAAATNRITNPQLADKDGNGIADGWSAVTNGNYDASFQIQAPSNGAPGEQIIRLTGIKAPTDEDWLGLSWKENGTKTKWALGAEVKIDWMPGTTDQEKNALPDFSVMATVDGKPANITLQKTDIGTGWRRIFINGLDLPAGRDFHAQLRCQSNAQNWQSAAGGIEIRFRKPQLENSVSSQGVAFSTPAVLPTDPGVTVNDKGEAHRDVGFVQIATAGDLRKSPFRLDTSKDWCFFVQWKPALDASEILLNDFFDWQILNIDDHWDSPAPVHNEIHLDISSGSLFPKGNRIAVFLWNYYPGNGTSLNQPAAADWILDSVDLTPYIRMGDVCRAVYWKTKGHHYVKMNVYRNGSLILSRMASQDLTVCNDSGILKKMTLGSEHKETGYASTLNSNSIFQFVSVEYSTINENIADAFLTTGARPQNPNTVARWDFSQGNDQVYVRPSK